MTPGYKVSVNGTDITRQVEARLLQISIQDQAGMENDRLSIELDDRPLEDGGYLEMPPHGAEVRVWLGYFPADNQTYPFPLKDMGTFTLDDLECEKGESGRILTLNCHALDQENSMKQPRTCSYHETTLGEIVTTCARRNGLTATVAANVGNIKVAHLDQTNQSDMAFLSKLMLQYGCTFKPQNRNLLFAKQGEIRKLMSQTGATITLDDRDTLQWRYLTQGRGRYTGVKATYYDKDKATRYIVSSALTQSRKEVYYSLPRTYSSVEEAQKAADAKKESFDKMECSFHCLAIGTPELMSEGVVTLKSFRPGVPTSWKLTKVTHRFTNHGYTSELEADAEGDQKGSGASTEATGE